MAGEDRDPQPGLNALQGLEAAPWRGDFYQLMRRLESAHPQWPRLGEAARPAQEPVRLGQRVELDFAPASLAAVSLLPSGRARIAVRFLGLFGPQAPMPIAITEFVRERERTHHDPTLARFADIFHHRLLLLFYRAWRQAQPCASRDRPRDDRFMTYVGALFGAASDASRDRDSVSDEARRFNAGHLSRSVRHGDALTSLLSAHFACPVEIVPYAARWLRLPADQWSRLGSQRTSGSGAADRSASTLGGGAVAGVRVLDAQHQLLLRLGPLDLAAYLRFLPGGAWLRQLRDWVRTVLDEEYETRALLLLREDAVPPLTLGGGRRLGLTSWLGRRPPGAGPAGDVIVAASQPT